MKNGFVKTANVIALSTALTRLWTRNDGVPGMALVYGDPGLGKTKATTWWVAQNEYVVYVRAKALTTPRSMLEALAGELGEDSGHRRATALYIDCRDNLINRKRMVLVDEVDYLLHDPRLIDTLRDLHDDTGAPVVLIGMAGVDKRLARYKPLYDRLSEMVPFKELSLADVRLIADQLCDIRLTPDAGQALHERARRFRQVVMFLYKIEHLARANSLKEVCADQIKGLK